MRQVYSQFTCFTSTPVQMLTPQEIFFTACHEEKSQRNIGKELVNLWNHLTSTKVRILTPEELRAWSEDKSQRIICSADGCYADVCSRMLTYADVC
jgi:hypothetical protein